MGKRRRVKWWRPKATNLFLLTLDPLKGANYLSLTSESEIMPVDNIGETAKMIEEDLTEWGIAKKDVEREIDAIT